MKASERLTHEEELQLVKQLPNKRVLDKLVTSNLGLVHKIVHRFPIKNCSCTYDDLFQEGVAGLIHGIGKFDVTKGYRLSTYCYRWIQAYVSRYYQNHGRTIRVPVHLSTKEMTARKQIERLTQELGHTPSDDEIADLCPEYSNIRRHMTPTLSLNQMISENDELESFAGDDNTEEKDICFEVDLLLDRLKDEVSDRDYQILIKRYGLNGNPEYTLSEIADEFGITRARSHQIEKALLKRLQKLT